MANFVTHSFPLCCGAQIITNLPSYFSGDKDEFRKAWIARMKKVVLGYGLSIVIIEEPSDYNEFTPMLEEVGFKKISESTMKIAPFKTSYMFIYELRKVNNKL